MTEDQDQFWSIDEIYVYKRALATDDTSDLTAPALSELSNPLKPHPVTQKTEVMISHDTSAIYPGFTLHEANMNKLWAPLTRVMAQYGTVMISKYMMLAQQKKNNYALTLAVLKHLLETPLPGRR